MLRTRAIVYVLLVVTLGTFSVRHRQHSGERAINWRDNRQMLC